MRVLLFRSGVKGVFCAGRFSLLPPSGLRAVPTSLQGLGEALDQLQYGTHCGHLTDVNADSGRKIPLPRIT